MFNLNEGILYSCFAREYGGAYVSTVGDYFWLILAGFLLVSLAAAYLLGSINSAILISKVIYHDDIRKHGSGNAGLTNMLRTYGKGAAGLTLLGDMLKTAIAIFICGILMGFFYVKGISAYFGWCYVAAVFAVLGHIFPIYYGGKGGKGVLVTITAALILSPIPAAIFLAIFVLIVAITKYVSLGSVTGALLYPVIVTVYIRVVGNAEPHFIHLTSIMILAVLILWCHRENLKRIGERTERKISFRKKDIEITAAKAEPESLLDDDE